MKYFTFILLSLSLLSFSIQKSQDYARHLELSLLFYEAQRSGPLSLENRIYWRHDSMVDAGYDVELDLSGGYYDAGDNCKFNFPQAGTLTLIAWSAIDFADGYKKAGQYKYVLDMIKWGTDYFIKCHPSKNELYITVGDASLDHSYWYPPEYINYEYPSYKIDPDHPGTEVAAETAATLAAASILFKEEDALYSELLLQHAIEIYNFADTYRGSFSESLPEMPNIYISTYYYDELAWGALWLYRATGNEEYRQKFEIITSESDYSDFDLPISWNNKYPGVYILAAQLLDESKYMIQAQKYTKILLNENKTNGGLYFCDNSKYGGSNRYAANAAATTLLLANILNEKNSIREQYINFAQKQINYILGDNPLGINYIVGAEKNSPKNINHKGASFSYDIKANPFNVYTLWGAMVGGPNENDFYEDVSSDYLKNGVSIDYNAGFTVALAGLINFGLGVKDENEILNFDRSWPKKAPIPDIKIEMTKNNLTISTGSDMLCGQFCVFFNTNYKIDKFSDEINAVKDDGPEYILCNGEKNGFLDGNRTQQIFEFEMENYTDFVPPEEYKLLCDGFYARKNGEEHVYRPDYGHMYRVLSPGGLNNTFPLFDDDGCWPSFVCDENKDSLAGNRKF